MNNKLIDPTSTSTIKHQIMNDFEHAGKEPAQRGAGAAAKHAHNEDIALASCMVMVLEHPSTV